jgi:TonB family protein
MLELKPSSKADISPAPEGHGSRQRSRMLLAIVLLLAALAVVLIKDRRLWFGDDDGISDDEVATATTPESSPQSGTAEAHEKAKAHSFSKKQDQETLAAEPVIETRRAAVSPLNVQIVSGNARHNLPIAGSNALQVEIPADSGEWRVWPTPQSRSNSGTTVYAAERVHMPIGGSSQSDGILSTPLLSKQMKVRGSVVLQALVSADGVIEDLHVLSGPAALASAAQEAIRQWRFKPYLQNGQPVETQANITVNFVISTS